MRRNRAGYQDGPGQWKKQTSLKNPFSAAPGREDKKNLFKMEIIFSYSQKEGDGLLIPVCD
jgi:hypothetical protein